MSRSNPQLVNPAQHFFRWAGSKGILQWYDKEKQKNVMVKLPFEFMVLDELSTITGYNKSLEQGYWANEVRNVMSDELFVKTKKGPFESGLYASLAQTRSKGGSYAKSIYIAHKIKNEWVIGNIQASGSALSSWIEFTKTLNRGALESGKVIMTRGEAQDAPTGPFYAPVFKYEKAPDDENAKAIELDKELQIYLSQYLAQPKVDDDARGTEEPIRTTHPEAMAPQHTSRSTADPDTLPLPHEQQDDIQIEDIDDEPINLDDIPF